MEARHPLASDGIRNSCVARVAGATEIACLAALAIRFGLFGIRARLREIGAAVSVLLATSGALTWLPPVVRREAAKFFACGQRGTLRAEIRAAVAPLPAVRSTGTGLPSICFAALVVVARRFALDVEVRAAVSPSLTILRALARRLWIVWPVAAEELAAGHVGAFLREVTAAVATVHAIRITLASPPRFHGGVAAIVRAGWITLLCVVGAAVAPLLAVLGALAGLPAIIARVAAPELTTR